MKIDPNAPAYPSTPSEGWTNLGIPIRLAIAAQIMASQASSGWVPAARDNATSFDPTFRAERAIEWADALIAAYNGSKE